MIRLTDETVTYRITGLHVGQQEVARSTARFRVLCCGRRWGKSRLGVALALDGALRGGRIWWVAPTYPLAAIGWRELRRMASKIPGSVIRLGTKTIHMPNGGGTIQVRTAATEGGLRGEGLDGLIYDECAQGREESWTDELRPALTDRKGWAVFISTPKGRANWFYRLWLRGSDGRDGWQSWQFPTASNPTIDDLDAEIEAARELLPLAVFEQEYLASFTDADTAVFDDVDIDRMVEGWHGWQEAKGGRRYLTTVDVGRRRDYTEILTIDYTAPPYQHVAHERLVGIPYPAIQSAIEARARAYHGKLIVESNGVGDPLIENLTVRATPFVTTARTKVQAIQALQALVERGAVRSGDPELIRQLRTYEWDDRGIVQDALMALAIAAAHLPNPGRPAYTPRKPDADRDRRARSETAGVLTAQW